MVKVFPRSAPVFGKSVTELKSIISIQYLFFFFQSFFELKVWNSPTDSYSCIQMYSSLVLATCNIARGETSVLALPFFVVAVFAVWIRSLPSFSFPCIVSFIVPFHLGKQDVSKKRIFLFRFVSPLVVHLLLMLQTSPVPLCNSSHEHALSWNPALVFSSFWYSVVCKKIVLEVFFRVIGHKCEREEKATMEFETNFTLGES